MKDGSKKNLTRFMSLFLAAVMCFGMLPVSVFATEPGEGGGGDGNQTMTVTTDMNGNVVSVTDTVGDGDDSGIAGDSVSAEDAGTAGDVGTADGETESEPSVPQPERVLNPLGLSTTFQNILRSGRADGGSSQKPTSTSKPPAASSKWGVRAAGFVRYTVARFPVSDVVQQNVSSTSEDEIPTNPESNGPDAIASAQAQWQKLYDCVVNGSKFPGPDDCLDGYPDCVTFAVSINAPITDQTGKQPAMGGVAFNSNILGYLWHEAHGDTDAYMNSVKGTFQDRWVPELNDREKNTTRPISFPNTINFSELPGGIANDPSITKPMEELFIDKTKNVRVDENGVAIQDEEEAELDSNGWNALCAIWDKMSEPQRALVVADAQAVAADQHTTYDKGATPAALLMAFTGTQNFCYKFIAEPGLGAIKPNGPASAIHGLTLRDMVYMMKYKGATFHNASTGVSYWPKAFGLLTTSVSPADEEFLIGWYKRAGNVASRICSVGGPTVTKDRPNAGYIFNRGEYNSITGSNGNTMDLGRAVKKYMVDGGNFDTFAVGVWSGWQAKKKIPPTPGGLIIRKSFDTELAGFTNSIFPVDITISGYPENIDLSGVKAVWTQGGTQGLVPGSWFGTTEKDLTDSGIDGKFFTSGGKTTVELDYVREGGNIVFKNIPFGSTSLDCSSLFNKEFAQQVNGCPITVTVQEHQMVKNIYGKDTFDKGGVITMSGSGTNELDSFEAPDGLGTFTFTAEFGADGSGPNVAIDIVNHFQGVQVLKNTGDSLKTAGAVADIVDVGPDHLWPMIVRFWPESEAGLDNPHPNEYKGDVYLHIIRGKRAGTDEADMVLTYEEGKGYRFSIYSSELVALYTKDITHSFMDKAPMVWYLEEDMEDPDNQKLLEMSRDPNDERVWAVGFYYNAEGRGVGNVDEAMNKDACETTFLYYNPDTGEYFDSVGSDGDIVYVPFREQPMVNDEEDKYTKGYARAEVVNSVAQPQPVHFIIDYNLNGKSATTADNKDGGRPYIEVDSGENPLDCGTLHTGDKVHIQLSSYVQSPVSVWSGEAGMLTYKYMGVYPAASAPTPITAADGRPVDSSVYEFDWVVPMQWLGKDVIADQEIVLYVRWEVEFDPNPDYEPGSGDGDDHLYWVYYDYNYDGGGVVSAMYGIFHAYESLSWTMNGSVITQSHTIKVHFSTPENPDRHGWTFMGWAEEPNAGDAKYPATSGNPVPIPEPAEGDTFFAVWKADDINWDANGGKFSNGETVHTWKGKVITPSMQIPIVDDEGDIAKEPEPTRTGYTFNGWYMDKECTIPAGQFEEGVDPANDTYYAGWTAEKVIVTYYDTRDGTTVVDKQTYDYNHPLNIFGPMEDTVGWKFSDWNVSHDGDGEWGANLDKANLNIDDDSPFKDLLVYHSYMDDGTERDPALMSDAGYWTLDFYAIWNVKLASYSLTINYNDFQNNDGARPSTLTVALVDSDNNNDEVPGTRRTIQLDKTADTENKELWVEMLPITDTDSSLQRRTYKMVTLGYTDCRGTYYEVTSPAIDGYSADWDVQTISNADDRTLTSYHVGVNNYAYNYGGGVTGTPRAARAAGAGNASGNDGSSQYDHGNYYTIITFDHALITTGDDIKFTIQWDDDNNNDGVRPGAVTLVMYAKNGNGTTQTVKEYPMHNSQNGIVSASPAICEVTNDGDTWTYIFRDYQKYDNMQPIEYTVAVTNDDQVTRFNKYGYKTEYLNPRNGGMYGDPNGCVISRANELAEIPVRIVWNDENNRDGQRTDTVSISLMSYQWNDHTYEWEYQEIDNQVLHADATNHMTAPFWYTTFPANKVYNDGERRIYHLEVRSELNVFIPDGSYEYSWAETVHGNQYPVNNNRNPANMLNDASKARNPVAEVTISQNTNVVSVTGQIFWDDMQNNDNIRPKNVIMQVFAHVPGGTPWPVEGQAYRVNVTGDPTADSWYHTFTNLPKYVDGQSGIELIYTIKAVEIDGEPLYGTYIITENGVEETIVRYTDTYLYENPDGMGAVGGTLETPDFNRSDRAYVKLSHTNETQSVDFTVDWHDRNNQDNVRPSYVKANLWKQVGDREPVKLFDKPLTFSSSDTGTGAAWTKKLTGLSNKEDGEFVTYILDVDQDEIDRLAAIGYMLTVEGHVIEMYYKTSEKSLEAYITWNDDNNNDGYRPENVLATLYKNGVATDMTVDLNETNGWRHTFENLDVFSIKKGMTGTPVVYSVRVQVPEQYTATYKPEDTILTDFNKLDGTGYVPLNITLSHTGDAKSVPVTINWNDNSDQDSKRPETITVQLLADGEVIEGKTLTLKASDFIGNQWTGEFTGLPVFSGDGKTVYYSVRVEDDTAVNGIYSIMTAGPTVYLAHDPVLSTMYVSFNYSDNNNADGKRPTGLYLQLTADGEPVDQSEYKHTVNLDPKVDGYRVEFGALPVYSVSGRKIAYNVIVSGLGSEQFGGEGYAPTYTADIKLSENSSAAANQVIVKLSRLSDTKTVTGSIYWFDVNNMSGHRPERLEIEVGSDYSSATRIYILDAAAGTVTDKETGNQVGELTVNEWTGDSSVWNYTIEGLRANRMTSEHELASVRYRATVDTASITPYYPSVQTGTSMNASLTSSDYEIYKQQATTQLKLEVQWIDNNDAWGYRPNTKGITVELMAGDEVYQTVVLTSANAVDGNSGLWAYEFKNLPSFRNGSGIAWTVRAVDTDKYTQSSVITEAEHSVIKFTQSQGFNFTLNWADSDNDDNRRLSELTLLVKADGSEAGKVIFTGESNTWTAKISDLPVWSESDPDRAIQYTFQWDDATAAALTESMYTASSTMGGAEVDSDTFYWLSANPFGENDAASGYDILSGTYEWETTLSYNKEVADYAFDISFNDDGDRDGIRPGTLNIELLADGKVIDTRQLTIDGETAAYQLKWEDMEVWEKAKAIVYTIRVADRCDGYDIAYNEANTSATLSHEPERLFITGLINWDDSTELKSLINAQGEYLRDYEYIGRVSVNMVFYADGQAMASMRIGKGVYGTDPENMRESYTVTYPWTGADKNAGGVYKYRDHGTEIIYTMSVGSNDLNVLLDDGYSLTYGDDRLSATVTHDLYDMNGKVYYLRNTNDDFLLRDGAATVTAYLQIGKEYVAQQSVKTDADGRYSFTNLPQGLYIVRAVYDYNGHAMAGTSGVTLDRRDASADVLVDRDAANDGFKYEYKASGKAFYQTDRRLDSTIKPVPEGSIVLLYKITDGQADPEYLMMTKTDVNGGYMFENLAPADYLVTVVFNYEDGVYTYDNADAVADGLSFNIAGMDTQWPDIIKQVNRGSDIIENPEDPAEPETPEKQPVPCIAEGYVFKSVNGTHTTEPIEGVDVHVYTYLDNREIGRTQTDKDGFWHIEGLAVGDYTAVFSKQGQSSRVLVFHITEDDFAEGVKTWTNNDPTQYFDESERTATSTVSGIVVSEGGRPMHTLVELYMVSSDGIETLYDFKHTDSQGKYEFTVAAGFTYKVRIYNVETVTETYNDDVGYPDNALTTLEEYVVTGRFVYQNEIQSGEAVLAYLQQADGSWKMITGTLTAPNGEYELRLKDSGNYRVVEYLDNGEYVDKYITVGYDRALPQVVQNTPSNFTITGTESFDSLVLTKNDSGVIKGRYEKKDTPYTGYSIPNQDAGEYTLVMEKDGKRKTYFVSCPEGALCDVTYEVTVSGMVLDEAGKAVIGSEVVLKNSDGEEIGKQIILSDGAYRFSDLPEGQYSVEVTKYFVRKSAESDGLLYSKLTTEADSFGNSYPEGITDGEAWVWNINASRVSGLVTDLDGNPVNDALLYFTPDGFVNYFTRTDADGRYVIGLPEGEYQVRYTLHQDLKHAVDGEAGTLSVQFGQVYEKNISNVAVKTVDVFAYRPEADDTRTALENTSVRVLYADSRDEAVSGVTGADGTASVKLIPGSYVLELSYMDSGKRVATSANLSITEDGVVALNSETLSVDVNGRTVASVAMLAGYTVSGMVVDASGNPVADAIVNFSQEDGRMSGRVYTDDNGRFSILVAAGQTGSYRLSVNGQNLDTGEYLIVAVDGDVSNVVLKLAAAGADQNYVVAGRVVDADGHPVEDAEVVLKTGSDKITYAVSSTDSDGCFSFKVASGTYYLSASYTDATGRVYVTNAETMAHASEESTEDTLVLLNAYELTVRVVDAQGNPVENARVAWRFAGGRTAEGYFNDTDVNGETTRSLFNSAYEFRASTQGRSSKWTYVVIPDDALVDETGRMVVTLVLGTAGLDTEATKPEVHVNGNGSLKIYGWVEAPAGTNGVLSPDTILVKLERYDVEHTQDGAETQWVEMGRTLADNDAYYEFTNLPYGHYHVSYDYTFETRASVTASGFIIDGTLQDANGGLYSNATVSLYVKHIAEDGLETVQSSAEVTTGEDGYFRFELPTEAAAAYYDGERWHLVTAEGDVYAEFRDGVVTSADKQYDANDLYWIEVHDAADALLYLGDVKPVSTALNIDGVSHDVDGKVWPYTHVDLYQGDIYVGTYVADERGEFAARADLESGVDYTAKVYVPVGPVNRMPYEADGVLGDYYTIDAVDSARAGAYIDKRTDGEWKNHVNVPYLRGLYDITGTVIDADGAPVEGAVVTLLDRTKNPVNKDGLTNPYITGTDGYYEFLGLEPGVYYVQVSYDGKDDAAVYEVVIDDGTDHKVTDLTEDDKPAEIAVGVSDYTGGKMKLETENGELYAVEGEAMGFVVNCDETCVVAVRVNGELTELACENTADGHEFTVEGLSAEDEAEIIVALLGDINLNGEANSEDLALFARYTFNEYDFNMDAGIQNMVADINHNGEANSEDLALFARYTFNEYDFAWTASR